MKTMTVPLEDEQIERIEEEGRRLGIPSVEVVQRAVNSYLGIPTKNGSGSENPILGIIGLGRSGKHRNADDIERILKEEYPRYIYEDSFSDFYSAPEAPDASTPSESDEDR
jgi:hypothetical protein